MFEDVEMKWIYFIPGGTKFQNTKFQISHVKKFYGLILPILQCFKTIVTGQPIKLRYSRVIV